MVNTRAKLRKTQNTLKICFSQSQAPFAEPDHLSTQSGALIGSNDDLLTKILHRVPATSILRFKSVSKHWLSLLTHRHFTLLFDNLAISPGLFVRNIYIPFDNESQNTPPFRRLDFYHDRCGIRIIQSCNGLLLCCSDMGNERARKYSVFNPTTKQFAMIPSLPGGREVRRCVRFMCLAYHPTDCVHYKIVCVHRLIPYSEECRIQIYSSDTGKWKITDQSFPDTYFTCGVYWKGAIHWAPSCTDPLYFKLDTEQLQKLPCPVKTTSRENYYDGLIPLYFGESRGHLHLMERAKDESFLHLNVYEMLSDHSGWFLKYQVELDELPDAYPEMINSYAHPSMSWYYEFEIFDVVRGEKEEDTFIVLGLPGKMIRYNVFDKSFKTISDLSKGFYGRIGQDNVHRYTEAIASF
ncbi:F-box protein At5g07610-like [Rutidosis leptorrhynchoides]|uniref:F-box protein At5g07610-like n=1 Tax=Rutidosis leptorrhynchoides TaxID=125765 RepID=UPI003A996305